MQDRRTKQFNICCLIRMIHRDYKLQTCNKLSVFFTLIPCRTYIVPLGYHCCLVSTE